MTCNDIKIRWVDPFLIELSKAKTFETLFDLTNRKNLFYFLILLILNRTGKGSLSM